MKTVILDENQYPFEVTPDAITTNFALFQKITAERNQLTLILFRNSDSADDIVTKREMGDWTEECIARGYFSYTGDKPNSHNWVSKIMPIGSEMSPTVMAALRSDIFTEVSKCFKGYTPDDQVTSEKRITDIKPLNAPNTKAETSRIAYVPWTDKKVDALKIQDTAISNRGVSGEIIVEPIYLRPTAKKQPTAEM